MEAINFLTDWTFWLFLLIPTGAGAMVTYQGYRKTITDDDGVITDCNKKIKHTIKGAIIGMTLSGFIQLIKSYYN